MIPLDFFILGYREMRVDVDYLTELTALLLRHGIPAKVYPSGTVLLRARDFTRVKPHLSASRIISVGDVKGIGGLFASAPRRIPSLVAFILCAAVYLFSSGVISDVRVSGNSSLTEREVTLMLADSGLSVGGLWRLTDRDKVELSLLEASPEISWVSINRQGSVAYVEIAERIGADTAPKPTAPVNIVAACDCVIDEITVRSGVAAVRVGDTVRKGDLLISGIIESEQGTEYVRADGTVRGSIVESVRTEAPRTQTKTLISDAGYAYLSLKIFNFRVNLLNNYGNSKNGCAIIDDVKECSLFGRRLPVSVLSGRAVRTETAERQLTDGELIALATERHNADIAALLGDADLIRVKTVGGFTEDGYYFESRLLLSLAVGEEKPILMGE